MPKLLSWQIYFVVDADVPSPTPGRQLPLMGKPRETLLIHCLLRDVNTYLQLLGRLLQVASAQGSPHGLGRRHSLDSAGKDATPTPGLVKT